MKPERNKNLTSNGIRMTCISAVILLASILTGTSFSQITGVSLESSSTIGARRCQVGGTYSLTGMAGSWSDGLLFMRYGFKAGLGITDHFDMKFSYNRWEYAESYDIGNAYQLVFKVNNNNQRFAFNIPVGYQTIKEEHSNEYSTNESIYYITPQLILNVIRTHYFEMDFSPYVEIIGEKGAMPFYTTGAAVGMGFSSNFNIWSLRAESSVDVLTLICGEPAYSLGAGLYINLGKLRGNEISH